MTKTVVRFQPAGRGAERMGVEVFVRGHLTGGATWNGSSPESSHEVVFPGARGRPVYVRARDIVAMVADDAVGNRYADIDRSADGVRRTVERLPGGEERHAVEATVEGRTASISLVMGGKPWPVALGSVTFDIPEEAAEMLRFMGWTVQTPDDAHVEPIGEPRFTVSHFGIPSIAEPGWWVVDATLSVPTIMAGPFPEQHLAQAEADDLNRGELNP